MVWINKPKRLYIIETDKKTFKVECERMDYKKTIISLKQAGYKNINISCLGFALHNNY